MKFTRRFASVLAGMTVMLAAGAALAEDGDPKKGEKVFRKCKACHVVDKEKNRVGPHLVGIIGRKAGAVEDFKYSKAMMEADIEWTEENIAKYLEKPKKFLEGTRMAFAGLRKEKDIVNVIAYLKEAGGTAE